MHLSDRIKLARIKKGATQKEIAQNCGMADSAIRKYESGKITPKLETLRKIAAALELPESFFMEMQPFQDLDFLAEFKAVILCSLNKNGFFEFGKRTLNQIEDFEYWKCIGDHIVSIVQTSDNSLSIQYKNRNEPENAKFSRKYLDLSKIGISQEEIENADIKKSSSNKIEDDKSEFMKVLEQLTPEQLDLVLERARAFAELNQAQKKKE